MTLEICAHVLPDMQRAAAETIGAILHGEIFVSKPVSKFAEIGESVREFECGAEERI